MGLGRGHGCSAGRTRGAHLTERTRTGLRIILGIAGAFMQDADFFPATTDLVASFGLAFAHLPKLQFENGDVLSRSSAFRTGCFHIRVPELSSCDAAGEGAGILSGKQFTERGRNLPGLRGRTR